MRWGLVGALLFGSPPTAAARPSAPALSLGRCERAASLESARFEAGTAKAVGVCLASMAKAVLQDQTDPATAAARVAPACVTAFRKLDDSRRLGLSFGEKMRARVAAKCDPGRPGVRHTLADVTGKGAGSVREPIETRDLDTWCRQFGGDGSIDTVDEWMDCLEASHQCAARAAASIRYPRGLEWLRLIVAAMGGLPSPAGDANRVADATAAAAATVAAIAGGSGNDAPGIHCGGLDSTCGDGVKDVADQCDGSDLGGQTCPGLGFLGGTLACDHGCRFDTTGCVTDLCGDGVRDGIESCDGSDLGGTTCATLGFGGGTLACTAGCALDQSGCVPAFPATGQTTCWNASGTVVPCAGTGQDGDVQAGSTLAYVDNGDGTITDTVTRLMWEKKSDDGTIHDKDTPYSFANAFAVHLAGLNAGAGFAGHTDWRLPNVKELQTIVSYQDVNPSVATPFNASCTAGCTVLTGSCTIGSFYWSSTSSVAFPSYGWYVNFSSGVVLNDTKVGGRFVRAVRGGS